jgi:hypothetical protein
MTRTKPSQLILTRKSRSLVHRDPSTATVQRNLVQLVPHFLLQFLLISKVGPEEHIISRRSELIVLNTAHFNITLFTH